MTVSMSAMQNIMTIMNGKAVKNSIAIVVFMTWGYIFPGWLISSAM